jgi:hypothetical protein
LVGEDLMAEGRQMSQVDVAVTPTPVKNVGPIEISFNADANPELMEHFGKKELNRHELDKMNDIYKWLGEEIEETNSRNILNKIRTIENYLRSHETRDIGKFWNFLAIKRMRGR